MGHDSAAITPVPPPPTSLAPGFRFHPTDEELVQYYLKRKACAKPFRFEAVSEIDVYKSEPWELAVESIDRIGAGGLQDKELQKMHDNEPYTCKNSGRTSGYSRLKTRDQEWYFFSPVDRKYGNGSRLNRATGNGYWKATGKDRTVRHKGQLIGMKKTLVFHSGRAPDGKRTNWVMHEYRLADEDLERAGLPQDAFVLCRIFQKSGLGPPNGDRYAPFIEEEWVEDAALVVPGGEAGDEMVNGDEAQVEGNELEKGNRSLGKAPLHETELLNGSQNVPLACKRERSEDCSLSCMADIESLSLVLCKRSKHEDPNSSHANGSEDSSTTTHDLHLSTTAATATTTIFSSGLLEFPLLEPMEPKGNQSSSPATFDAANLEKSVPPGYLKFINNLENEILNVSMERETLKIEVMRAQAMINILQSRIEILNKENEDMKRVVRDV